MKLYKIYGHHLKNAKSKEGWYVGYTEQELEKRWRKNGKAYDKRHIKFYNALKKYGWDAFDHILIAETGTIESALIIEEMFKIMYNSVENGYNCYYSEQESPSKNPEVAKKISKAIKGKYIGKHHSPETEIKKGQHLSPDTEFKPGQTSYNKGKKFTEEHKQKLSESHMGQKGHTKNKGKGWKMIDGKRVWFNKETK